MNKNSLGQVPIHTLLFVLYPILYLYAENIRETPFSSTFIPGAVVLFFSGFLFLTIWLGLKDLYKTGLITTLIVFVIFSYGHFYQLLGDGQINHSILISVWAVFLFLPLFFIVKTEKNLKKLTAIINIIGSVLILIVIFNVAIYKIKNPGSWWQRPELNSEKEATDRQISRDLPDIYYIVFDRYADNESLKKEYNHDNTEFTRSLEEKGFFVADQSHSNYLKTAHSLTSIFSMEYLDNYVGLMGEENDSWLPLYSAIVGKSKVWQFLEGKGYFYIHAGSWWPPTNHNKYADININLYRTPDFAIMLYGTTILRPISDRLGLDSNIFRGLDRHQYVYQTTLDQIEMLKKIPSFSESTYTFTHFIVPHDPYVFNKDGSFVSWEQSEKGDYRENYINQLKFTNYKIIEIVDELIKNSKIPPIIIIQSDEGPFPQRWDDNEEYLSWESASQEELRTKSGILNALYLPGDIKIKPYSNITSVNTFRLIFSNYFEADLPLLPDKNYAHTDIVHPYKLFEITDQIK